jgi:hypothetical protein
MAEVERHRELDKRFKLYGVGQTVFAILLLLFFVTSIVLGVWALYRLGVLLEESKIQSERNGQVLSRLIDCTSPEGHCYQESQRRTGESVATINQITVAAGYCAQALPRESTLAQYRKCIEVELQKGSK